MAWMTINGRPVEAGESQTVLRAALEAGVYIPHLCDHPDLTPAGQCRLCVVDVRGRGVVAACQTAVEEGLQVVTESSELQQARQVTLELMLARHRGDCLSCSRDGTCELQTVAAHIGVDRERLSTFRAAGEAALVDAGNPCFTRDRSTFRAAGEAAPVDASNPFFTRDPGRCVLCGRCVRTCDELQGIGALSFAGAGSQTWVAAGAGVPLARSRCESCGECLVRCPTAALELTAFERPACEIKTVCTFCGVGCSLYLGVRGTRVVSARGDRESTVNRGQLCVKGRFGNAFVNSPDRLATPLMRKNGRSSDLEPVSWDEALDAVARRLGDLRGDGFAAIGSSRATNEENYLMQKFARAAMGTNNVDNCARLCHAPTVAGLSKSFGTGGGTNPISEIDGAGCILVIGSNTTSAHPVVGSRLRRAARHADLVVIDPRRIELCDHADQWLPARSGTDVALLMGMMKVIVDEGLHDAAYLQERCTGYEEFERALQDYDVGKVAEITGVPAQAVVEAARRVAGRKPLLIVYSLGMTEHTHGTDNVTALASLALLTGSVGKPSGGVMPMRGQNNVQGACDMGCLPGSFPGYQPVTDEAARRNFEEAWGCRLPERPGFTVVEMFDAMHRGDLRAMYVMGMDPAFSVADAARVQEALKRADFLVFQDIFLTESARYADVVLPAASFAEKDGTFTNLERRVQRVRQAVPPVGESRPDWEILCDLAHRMDVPGFDFSHPGEILDELASLTPPFRGISLDRLESGGLQWPCPDRDHPGTTRLHVERFNTPDGRARLVPLQYRPPLQQPDEAWPFLLNTGRSLYHFHLAMTCHVPGLMALCPEEEVWVNPRDGQRLGVSTGDMVKVSSPRGQVQARARVTDDVLPGDAFMTFHFYACPTNVLTAPDVDPVARTPGFKTTAVRIERMQG